MDGQAELIAQIEACAVCSIGKLAQHKRHVPGLLGKHYIGMALLCEAPGAQEDETGQPLVGRAGQFNDKMLADAGLSRESLLLMNRVRCRPPNNQLKNHPDAIVRCNEWTKRELELYNPRVVVLMGATAMEGIFGTKVKVGETRGVVRRTGPDFEFGARIWVPTYHPAAVARPTGRQNRPLVVGDLMLARQLLLEEMKHDAANDVSI